MSAKGYRFAVAWVAENDGAGDDDALDPSAIAHLISVLLVADIYGKAPENIGRDIVRYRKTKMGMTTP